MAIVGPKFAWFRTCLKNNHFTKRTLKTLSNLTEFKTDESVDPNAQLRDFKKHVGKYSVRGIKVPEYLEMSINDVLSDENLPNLREEAKLFREKLIQRDTLFEKNRKKYRHVTEQYIQRLNDPENVELIGERAVRKLERDIEISLAEKNKDKIEYRHKESLLYLASRFAPEYSTLIQIFTEIKKRDANFQPKRLFDLGSGVGTSMWAANTFWDSQPIETLNYDISTYMNMTAQAVIQKCKSKKPFFKHVKFKRNLPKSFTEEFDLITCSFTLLDLPDRLDRLEKVEVMWKMLAKDGYLVLVENGNTKGFEAIIEIRDFFIKELSKPHSDDPSTLNGHIFSPCPNHMECPLAKEDFVCKFKVSHKPLPIYDFLSMRNDLKEFPYSYLVLKKSPKPINYCGWPRFVLKDPQLKQKSTYAAWICRGDVERVDNFLSSKSRDKITNWIVRYSRAGDCLPVSIQDDSSKNLSNKP